MMTLQMPSPDANPVEERGPIRLRALDVMSKPVVVISQDSSVREAAQTMAEHRISGLVVQDPHRKGIGIISASDIVTYESTRHEHIVSQQEHEKLMADACRSFPDGFQLEHVDDETVNDVMTHGIVTASPETTLGHIAWMMSQKRIHRVCIEESGRIVGIVTALDVARAFGRSSGPACSLG